MKTDNIEESLMDADVEQRPKTPIEYVEEHADDLPDEVVERATDLFEVWDGWKYGRSPATSAAMAVYYVLPEDADDGLTQEEAAEMFDTTPVSVRSTWETVLDEADHDEISEVVGWTVRKRQ